MSSSLPRLAGQRHRKRILGQSELHREVEYAFRVQFTLHPDFPASHLNEARRNRESKARARRTAGRGAICLREGFEDYLLLTSAMPILCPQQKSNSLTPFTAAAA